MNCLDHLPEFAQIYALWVGDAIQPSHPLPPPSPFAFNLSQNRGLFQWVGSFHQLAVGTSASVLPMNIQGWFPLGLTGLISLQSKGLLRVFSNTTVGKHQLFDSQPSLWSNSHLYMTARKTIALTIWTFVTKVMFLLFNRLPRFVIAFLPRNKCLLISWLQLPW